MENTVQPSGATSNLPVLVVRYDTELHRTYVNPAWEKANGLSAWDFINLPASSILKVPLPTANEYMAKLRKVLETGTVQSIEFPWENARGETLYLDYTIVPELDRQKKIIGALCVGHDITKRKRTEDALYFVAQCGWKESAENFFDVLAKYLGETLSVDYVVIDRLDKDSDIAETVALYAKGATVPNMRYVLKGTPCENVMGRKFCFYQQGIQQLFPDDVLLVEMGAESYAGLPLWDSAGQPIGLIAVMDSKPLPDERGILRLLQIVAIRAAAELERERSDRTLREREHEFRTLAENMPDNLIRYDQQARVRYMNPAFRSSLLPELLPALGESPTETYPGNGAVAEYQRVLERVAATGNAAEMEILVPNSQGEICTHHIRFTAERDVKSEVVGVLAIGRDITERKKAEQELHKLSAHLQTVREEEKARLAREIHDDLGSVLSALKIEGQMLYGELSDEQKAMPQFARVESMVELLDEAVKATRRIISDLRPAELDDLGLMAAVEWQADQFYKHTGIECRVDCILREENGCTDCKDCEYTLDKTLSINLFRIFQESLTNIARHSGASRVEVEFQPSEREAVLSIRDNGRGLPQGHAIPSTSYGIRGMRERVERLGGLIAFDSRPGGGLSVMVRLPQPAVDNNWQS